MKKSIIILLFSLSPILVSAQNPGGEVRRHDKGKEPVKEVPSRKQKSKQITMSESQRQSVIQNLINNMVYVEGGTFMMGSTPIQDKDPRGLYGQKLEKKEGHKVIVSDFFIGKYEVTQEEWIAVMGNHPYWRKYSKSLKEDGELNKRKPAFCLTWYECNEFCKKLSSLMKQEFRLPTEAEWEFAARGGNSSLGYIYPGGNIPDEIGWYSKNTKNKYGRNSFQVVGQKRPNELGLYDMGGNVAEWCLDWFVKDEEYFNNSSEPLVNPAIMKEPPTRRLYNSDKTNYYDDKPEKSFRGGAYYLSIDKVNQRSCTSPNREDQEHGFRLVKVVRQK